MGRREPSVKHTRTPSFLSFMALAVAIAVPVAIGVGVAIAAIDDDDSSTKLGRKQRRSEKLALHPLNTRTVVLDGSKGHLGITLQGMGEEAFGVRVKSVEAGDLAAQAGLKEKDWIVKVNGAVVETHYEAMSLIKFTVANGALLQLEVMTPRTVAIDVNTAQHLGVKLRNEPLHRGVMVEWVEPFDLVAQLGLSTGDVITKIDGWSVQDHEEVLRRLSNKRWFNKSKPRVVQVTFMTSGAGGIKQ